MTNKLLSLSALCKELSISEATGRNWIRLGKLIPSSYDAGSPRFEQDYVKELMHNLASGKNASLKSRRNKTYISGRGMYSSYVAASSPNISVVRSVLDFIEQHTGGFELSDGLTLSILAECALQLLSQRFCGKAGTGLLRSFSTKDNHDDSAVSGIAPAHFLVSDLLSCSGKAPDSEFQELSARNAQSHTASTRPDLFSHKFTYIPGEDTLGLLYISLNNLGKRKARGAYYTPTEVVKKLCDSLFVNEGLSEKDILDPCCGTGNFILQLPDGALYDHVFGGDTDPVSVRLARINYCLKFGITDPGAVCSHIKESDFLTSDDKKKYDYILGNPPWGSSFSDRQKNDLRITFSSAKGKNIESYDVFTEQALRRLAPGGLLSFVLPEAILNVRYHREIREILLRKSNFERVEFLGDVFDNVQCPSIILKARRTDSSFDTKGLVITDRERQYTIRTSRPVSPDAFDFFMTDEEYRIIEKMDTLPGAVTLKGSADFALGIVTGDNNRFISHKKTPDNEIIIRGSDLKKYYFEPADNYITFEPGAFQQVANESFYRAKEKLFYRFISSTPVFAYDNSAALSLNSCNILIPRIEGLDIKYILAVLNSDIVRFYCRKRFNSVKVLRSHIESIPIPMANADAQARIISHVDEILRLRDESAAKELQAEIENELLALYGLKDMWPLP